MQMKKITLLLMVFALAWSGQLKAVTLPETSKDGKVKWYFIQSMRQDYGEPMFYTVDGDLIRGRVKADYSDYATLAKQLWCFETEDGERYTITNRYDGRKLGVGMGPNGESLMMQDAPQAKFRLRDLTASTGEDCVGLESDIPAPGGGDIFRYPTLTGPNDNLDAIVWLARADFSTGFDSAIKTVEFTDTYSPQNSETVTWYNIASTKAGNEGRIIVDNTSVVDAQYKFTVDTKESSDLNAQWRLVETDPGKVSIVNRATGNSISTNLTIEDKYNVPTADGKGIVATTWNILPIAEGQYAISSVGNDKVMRLLNAQTLGSETDELPDTDLNGTGFAWAFSQADTEVGINTVTQQDGNVRVENGRIIAPEGAKVNVFTPEGVEMPADSKLMPGIYIVTVNGKATKILVH